MRKGTGRTGDASRARQARVKACSVLVALVLLSTAARAEETATLQIAAEGTVAEARAGDAVATGPDLELLVAPRFHWSDRFAFDEEFQLSDQLSLAFETELADRRERFLERSLNADPAALLLWERKTVGGTTIRMGALGGRLRLTTRYGWSRYDRSETGVDAFVNSDGLGARWAAQSDVARDAETGQAFAQRLEASLWSSNVVDVSLFGAYQQVDASFFADESSGKRRKGLQAASAGRKTEYGGKLRVGPVQLTLAQEQSRRWEGDDLEQLGPQHRVARAAATVSLYDLRERAGRALGKPVANLLPGSVWASIADGRVAADGERLVEDGTRDTVFGMSWDGANWSMNLDYWRSVYDNRQPGAEEADWIGEGAYLGWGYYAARWDVYLTAGFSRYANEAPSNRSVDFNLDGSLTFALRPEYLPDLATTVSYGGYQSDYLAWDIESRTRSMSIGASLDFTKYLRAVSEGHGPAVRAAYRFSASRTRDGFSSFSTNGEHAALLMVEVGF